MAPSRALPLVAAIVGLVAHPAAATPTPALLQEFCGSCHFDGGRKGASPSISWWPPMRPRPDRRTPRSNRLDERLEESPGRDDAPGRRGAAAGSRAAGRWWTSCSATCSASIRSGPTRAASCSDGSTASNMRNTIRDLTGFDADVADDLPPDDTGYGFDTIGDVLSLSPLLLEKYLEIAARVADQVVAEAGGRRIARSYPGPVRSAVSPPGRRRGPGGPRRPSAGHASAACRPRLSPPGR